ncbi:MAG: homocysteine S-methyltransferase family protein, partial [Anaerolineae bacterium]
MDATRPDIASALAQRVLVADGAMGTMLHAAGLTAGTPPEAWNLDNPDAVRAVHAAYIAAGADIVLTNTIGGSGHKLARHGLGSQAAAINRAAAALARQAAGDGHFVFGSIGSTGELLQPLGLLTFAQARDTYAAQAEALAAGGADAILLETMSDIQEAHAGIEGARIGCGLPVVCTFSFDRGQRSMMGVGAEQVAELWPEGLLAIGANCGRSLEDTLAVVARLRALLPTATLMAKPNAGVPTLGADGRTHFDVGPEEMADFVVRFLDLGVRIVGGCCGSTPAHIA